MSERVGIEQLGECINKIIDDYKDTCKIEIQEATLEVAKEAKKIVSNSAPRLTGVYARGFKLKKEVSEYKTNVTLYNARKPGLTHLLEHGHAFKKGGRAKAIKHIGNGEDYVIEELPSRIVKKLEK